MYHGSYASCSCSYTKDGVLVYRRQPKPPQKGGFGVPDRPAAARQNPPQKGGFWRSGPPGRRWPKPPQRGVLAFRAPSATADSDIEQG